MVKKKAHLIGAGNGAEAAALDVDDLVVRALVGGDGVDGGSGAGGGDENKLLLVAGIALRRGDTLRDRSGDAARTCHRGEMGSSVASSDFNFINNRLSSVCASTSGHQPGLHAAHADGDFAALILSWKDLDHSLHHLAVGVVYVAAAVIIHSRYGEAVLEVT